MSTKFENLKIEIEKRRKEHKDSPLESHFKKWFDFVGIHGYIAEYPVDIYTLDFAWPDIKFCVEADGEIFHTNKIKDEKRDLYLKSLGWETYRVPSKESWRLNIFQRHLTNIFERTQPMARPTYGLIEMRNYDPENELAWIRKSNSKEQKFLEENNYGNHYTGYCEKCNNFYSNHAQCKCP